MATATEHNVKTHFGGVAEQNRLQIFFYFCFFFCVCSTSCRFCVKIKSRIINSYSIGCGVGGGIWSCWHDIAVRCDFLLSFFTVRRAEIVNFHDDFVQFHFIFAACTWFSASRSFIVVNACKLLFIYQIRVDFPLSLVCRSVLEHSVKVSSLPIYLLVATAMLQTHYIVHFSVFQFRL